MVVVGYNMKTIQTKSGEVLLIKIPEDTTWWELIENDFVSFITKELNLGYYFLSYGKHLTMFGKESPNMTYYNSDNFFLPKGHLKIVGKFSELEDKTFEEFVEKEECGSNNFYFWDYNNNFAEFVKAKDSFDTLCKSQGIEDNLDNYLIIKKI